MLPKIRLPQKPLYQKVELKVDFFEWFKLIEDNFEYCFLLESLGDQNFDARYSIIGFAPASLIKAKDWILYITKPNLPEIFEPVNSFDQVDFELKLTDLNPYWSLREMVPQDIISRNYAGGLVGYLSYESVNYLEPKLNLRTHPDFHQFQFGLYTDGLIYDQMTGEVSYFYYHQPRLEQVLNLLHQKPRTKSLKVQFLGHTLSPTEHRRVVLETMEEIKAGNSFQCEVGFKSKYLFEGDNYLAIYEKLRQVNPSPYMFYCKFGSEILLGASPELLFRTRNREIETVPLAGTIRRGQTPEEDRELAKELLNNPKEIAEHNMLVDLHRNDIGKVATFGSVKVRRLMEIKKFSHVQHISSEIVGILRDGEDMFTGLASLFPGGVLSGAPKIETIKIIARNENEPRGPYGGALGQFGFNGNCTFCIPIRSLFIKQEGSQARAYTQTCSGIVFDSDPDKEYQEIINKLEAMRKVLDTFT